MSSAFRLFSKFAAWRDNPLEHERFRAACDIVCDDLTTLMKAEGLLGKAADDVTLQPIDVWPDEAVRLINLALRQYRLHPAFNDEERLTDRAALDALQEIFDHELLRRRRAAAAIERRPS